jgi:L-alanine-DL-glutamate epimerase-like enolase superfamily enzyme
VAPHGTLLPDRLATTPPAATPFAPVSKPTDISVRAAELFLLPVHNRVPLKFGAQVVTGAVCARVRVRVQDRQGRSAEGWGETPLSVAWVWPAPLTWDEREQRMIAFCTRLIQELVAFDEAGHPMELGHRFQQQRLDQLLAEENQGRAPEAEMPHLAALVCLSAFDLAVFDAFGHLTGRPVFETLGEDLLTSDLGDFLEPRERFAGLRPPAFLKPRLDQLPVWHLIGGLDPIGPEELTGKEPNDGYPILLRDWIRADGLQCLKIKLRGTDAEWDYDRIVRVGRISLEEGVTWLTADFNCTVTDPSYVTDILDRLLEAEPRIYGMLLYIEQPFPYDLERSRIDAHSVTARKPLFLDESAHDWHFVRLGRELGWSGVALKTCKTLTGALLSLCWARAHGMTLMVQDLSNPMFAQVPHVLLAAHAGTIMGVESNGMQFYPEASAPEREVHPGIYKRKNGKLDLTTLTGPGFGYHAEKIQRVLPAPHASAAK